LAKAGAVTSARQRRLGNPGHRTPQSAGMVTVSPVRAVADIPKAPAGLGVAGRAEWRAAWRGAWIDPGQHREVVAELCRLADDLVVYRKALSDHGVLVTEPIVSPRGDVVGERLVPNPAEQMVRRTGRSIADLRAVLGLTPQAKARLGLVVLEAEQRKGRIEEMMEARAKVRAA
jgi:P27 family predicted phage terminase small subunit